MSELEKVTLDLTLEQAARLYALTGIVVYEDEVIRTVRRLLSNAIGDAPVGMYEASIRIGKVMPGGLEAIGVPR